MLVKGSSMLDFFHFFCLAFACGISCNARPLCSRSAGSIRRASRRARLQPCQGLEVVENRPTFLLKATWGGLRLRSAAQAPRRLQRVPWLKRRQDAPQRPSRGLLFCICFLMSLEIDFYWILGANLTPFWPPKSIKIH